MKSRKSLIRAILFVVRLQKSVAGHSGTLKRRNSNKRPKTTNGGHSPLKRCDSTRIRGKASSQKLLAQHRNSAPTTMFRASTPQIEIVFEPDAHHFASFSHMVPPYSLRLERQNSGGKVQIYLRPTVAHQIAARIMLQKQPSLDDRITWATRVPNESNKPGVVRRQGSVEGTSSKVKTPPDEVQLVRKLKVNMINLLGALNAVESNDLDTLRLILSKNCISINGFLDSGLYNQFRIKLTLLDVALMLHRPHVATLLLQNGATENFNLSQPSRRRKVVDEVLYENESRISSLREKHPLSKDEEKKLKTFESHSTTLKKMKNVLEQQEFPGPPTDVKVSVASSSRAILDFNLPPNPRAVVIKYKIEWSTSSDFETIDGSLVVRDMRLTSVNIDNLEHGQCYSFRICAGSMWGYSEFTTASPKAIRISSWEDVEGCENNREAHMRAIAELHGQVERHRQSAVWQKIFPNCSELNIKKKKTGLRNLFSASSKFAKHVQKGLYLSTVIYTEDKVLCTVDDLLPTLLIDENTSISADDMNWLLKLSLCWDQVGYLQDTVGGTWSNNSQLRVKILDAVASMHNALGVKDIGRIHHIPLIHSSGTTFLVSVHFVSENQAVQGLAMRWMRLSKLMRKKSPSTAFDFLSKEIVTVLNFFESAQIPLERGLYLCYMRLQSSLNTIKVTVPDNLPSVLPFVSVRTNPHVSKEEWEWLRVVEQDGRARPNAAQYTFHMQMSRSLNTLLHDLELDHDLIQSHRLYRFQVLQLHSDVSFILVLPKAEEVCLVNAGLSSIDESIEHCKGCTSISIPVFDMINLSTYQPVFIATYCRLSIFLEHFTMLINYEKRQCLLEDDRRVYSEQLEKLTDFQQKLDEIWRNARWISNIASIARDKHSDCGISLSRILLPPMTSPLSDDGADVGYHSDQSSDKCITFDTISTTSMDLSCSKETNPSNAVKKFMNRSKSMIMDEISIENIDKLFLEDNISVSSNIESGPARYKTNNHSPSPLSFMERLNGSVNTLKPVASGILRVFPAYECGLAEGASVRLQITSLTTSEEVVSLVLNQIAKITSKSVDYDVPQLDDFCLVSVVGARERRLREGFPPLTLQAPWNKGKLFVRRKCDISAAIIRGNEAAV